jgi:predicted small integral membrane protein
MLRKIKVLLIITVALWGFIGAFGNLHDWSGTIAAVGAVTSMTTFDGGSTSWQATSSPIVIWVGAIFIMLSKLATGILCSIGAWKMWNSNNNNISEFLAAKKIALAGCAIAVIMLFGGFIVIAESWFELWRSDVMRGPVLGSAFRYGSMILLISLFVGLPDDLEETKG